MAAATYPVSTIARLLLLTERRVQQLTKAGVLPKAERGHYELAPAVQGYIKYLRDRNIGADDPAADIGAFRARLVKAKAQAAEIEVDSLIGERLLQADVERAWQAILVPLRAGLIGLPTRMATAVANAETPREAQQILQQVVGEFLEIISSQPVYAEAGSPEADEAPDDMGADLDEAAADPDGEPVGRRATGVVSRGKRGTGAVEHGAG
jgi:phage terminase Nu1 subunit (DNA packaging protein)